MVDCDGSRLSVARLCPDVIVADISMPNLDGIGAGRVEKTVPMAFSADETCDVGKEAGSPVSPEERFRAAMARQ